MLPGEVSNRGLSYVFGYSSALAVAAVIGLYFGSVEVCSVIGIPEIGDNWDDSSSELEKFLRIGTEIKSPRNEMGVCSFVVQCYTVSATSVMQCFNYEYIPSSVSCWSHEGFPSCTVPWNVLLPPKFLAVFFAVLAVWLYIRSIRSN